MSTLPHRRLALAAALALAPAPAEAWQLPARHALHRAQKAVSTPPGPFDVTFQGRIRGPRGPDDAVTVAGRWVFNRSTRGAAVSVRRSSGEVLTWTRGAVTAGEAAVSPAEQVVLPRLFADADLAGLVQQLGIDTERQHLGLVGDAVADVIGARARDESSPQLWLEHTTFRPLRVVFRVRGGGLTRIDLTDWASEPDGIDFPRAIRVFVDGRWERVMELEPARPRKG